MQDERHHPITSYTAQKGQLRHDAIKEKYLGMGFDVETWDIRRYGIDLRAISPDKTEIDIFELTNWAQTTFMTKGRMFRIVNNLILEKRELQEKYPEAVIMPILIVSYFKHLEHYLDYLRVEGIRWSVEGELGE